MVAIESIWVYNPIGSSTNDVMNLKEGVDDFATAVQKLDNQGNVQNYVIFGGACRPLYF